MTLTKSQSLLSSTTSVHNPALEHRHSGVSIISTSSW